LIKIYFILENPHFWTSSLLYKSFNFSYSNNQAIRSF